MIRKFYIAFLLLVFYQAEAQVSRFTYHDADKKNVKEIYQVKDTVSNILQGKYISYFLNGHIESKGQFANNETIGVWEFYYETGHLKMRGILRQNSNYGLWEYFYENGEKSMEGTVDGKLKEGIWKIYYESGELKEMGEYAANKRTGIWKTYYEDGAKQGEIEYVNDQGKFTEYYRSGRVLAEGQKVGPKNVGHWRTYTADGTLESEGDYNSLGKKTGEWKSYYPSGKIASVGNYENDNPNGVWTYYYENGKVSSLGEFQRGNKNGLWSSFNKDGSKRSIVTYVNGSGNYEEYYSSGHLRIKGQIVNEKNQGRWQYFYEDGKLEGDCDFDKGEGIYQGYYPNGKLQAKGKLVNDLRMGTWELYGQDGKLTGYYKPIYTNNNLADDISAMAQRSKALSPNTILPPKKNAFLHHHFTPQSSEYKSIIFQGNPAFMFMGSLPLSLEFYKEARLGYELSFDGIRNPFFTSDDKVAINKLFTRGYAVALRQKFYNPLKTGMWYFGHELRYTDLNYHNNINLQTYVVTTSATEMSIAYGVFLGYRLMQYQIKDGFTLDAFVGYDIGYKNVNIDPQFQSQFSSVNTDRLAQAFRFGLNIGYSFSFDSK